MTTKSSTSVPPLPKFDVEALFALQKSNVETFVAAQKILFDLAQTIAKRQSELLKESFVQSEAFFKGFDAKKQPQAYVDDAKAAVEKAIAEAKETIDLGLKAQTEVVDLFVKRASANFEEAKTLAA